MKLYTPPIEWRVLACLHLGYVGRELVWFINYNTHLHAFFLTNADGYTVARGSFQHCFNIAEGTHDAA
jgi:hypothetical protein